MADSAIDNDELPAYDEATSKAINLDELLAMRKGVGERKRKLYREVVGGIIVKANEFVRSDQLHKFSFTEYINNNVLQKKDLQFDEKIFMEILDELTRDSIYHMNLNIKQDELKSGYGKKSRKEKIRTAMNNTRTTVCSVVVNLKPEIRKSLEAESL